MKVVFIGSGNVATHMALAFKEAGHNLAQVFSRNLNHAQELAARVDAIAVDDIAQLDKLADVYVVSVSDSAISEVVQELNGIGGLILHTSGSTAISVLSGYNKYGVLYPLQTFSKSVNLTFKEVPLFVEAGDEASLILLKSLATGLSDKVYEANSEQRRTLHIGAVFVCNFVNQLYQLGAELLEANQLDFEMLRPLIMETARKVQHECPLRVQTGPAVRNDQVTIDSHMELLKTTPELSSIYQILSNSIKKTHQY